MEGKEKRDSRSLAAKTEMAMAEEKAVVDMIRIETCSLICKMHTGSVSAHRSSRRRTYVDRRVQPSPNTSPLMAGQDRFPELEDDKADHHNE
jgi:hypothetical protein